MITIFTITEELKKHNVPEEKLNEINKAYLLAAEIHKNQFRQSGEPYIIHPLNVAYNLIKFEVYDPDTISAALLHDTVEDAEFDFTIEDVAKIINPTVAELVDGVTKMRRMNFSTKTNQNQANMRKILNGLTKDVRIILIKLADRLHNMETLEYKTPEKQLENATETMKLYVPLALTIGAYRIKNALEDLSLKYIDPEEFKKISEQKDYLQETYDVMLKEMAEKISEMLNRKIIPHEIIFRMQTINSIYKRLKKGYKVENIYDLFYLKILVEDTDACFRTLNIIHEINPPLNGRFKDYIHNPKTNFYRSLHTTVSNKNNSLVKVKIRTPEMDKIAAFGIPAYWNIKGGKTIEETQEMIRDKCQFAKKLNEIDGTTDDEVFAFLTDGELLTEHVYVYTHNGENIELPFGSTCLDFVCQMYPELLDKVTGVLVNGKDDVPLNYQLHNNDRVQILMNGIINHKNWESMVHNPLAREKVKQMIEKN